MSSLAAETPVPTTAALAATALSLACAACGGAAVVRAEAPPLAHHARLAEGGTEDRAEGGTEDGAEDGAEGEAEIDDDAVLDAEDAPARRYPGPRPLTISERMTQRCERHRSTLERAAVQAGLDPLLMLAIAWVESGFNPEAVSSAGALGIMQLVPRTSAAFGCTDPTEPDCAAAAAAAYLNRLLKRFDGQLLYALCAYHAGHVAPLRAWRGGRLPANVSYAERIFEAKARLARSGCRGQ